jgi:2-amino-4-hydroxy-6-hydroxymethyldihydropteridine diphosphokinase
MHDCLIAFGSNEGSTGNILQQAVFELEQTSEVQVSACSQPLTTQAVGGPKDQPCFLNAAIRIQTSRSPIEIHKRLVEIESKLGRKRRERWGPRKIDLDLLLFDERSVETENLVIPHPRMSFRRFVLEPAAEIAADMVHVTSGLTLDQLIRHLNERDNLIVYVRRGRDDELSSTIGSIVPATWKFENVSPAEFSGYQSKAKLVAYVVVLDSNRGSNNQPSRSSRISFAGPTLELPAEPDQARIEIAAAIDAMAPLVI